MKSPEVNNKPAQDQWWREWFNQIYLDVYAHRDDESAFHEVQQACSHMDLTSDMRIIDLCCGNGRHCRALRKQGYSRVWGIDYSYPLLRQAYSLSPQAHYIRADMRMLPFKDEYFDVLFSFFTSFGYFQTTVENIAVLHEISRVLRPHGQFFFDYLNPDYVQETIEPETKRIQGDFIIQEYRTLSEDGKRIEKEIVIRNWGDKEHRFYESVRLYSLEEMQEMLECADLQINNILGNFDGSRYSPSSPRMIFIGIRPSEREG